MGALYARTAVHSVALLSLFHSLCSASNDTVKSQPLRFWIDEYAFSEGETTLLREIIQEAGDEHALIVGESNNAFLSVKGYYAPEQWDVYWTGRQGCMQALPHALPGHKISCVPGLHELTMKDRLAARLTHFYGEGAFQIIPRSYLLPMQYWQWRLWLARQAPEARGEMWVLKEERHRGKGVHVMPLPEAIQKAKVRNFEGNYDLAQAYVANQMTVNGRKFYVRLWAVVTSSFPLRAYLFDGGVVIFGNTTPDQQRKGNSDDLIVNLWSLGRTTEAPPWSIAEFRDYLDNLAGSRSTFDSMWRQMQRSLGLTFAAGTQAMRFSAAAFPVAAAGATFEVVGVDFLVDEHMKPWLLEVNAVPSLARQVIHCDQQPGGCRAEGEPASVFDSEKERFVNSLFRLLQATAGTGVSPGTTGQDTGLTLADFLARWSTNATDLAALNLSQNAAQSAVHSDLGWQSTGQSAGRDLSNSGRELKSADDSSTGLTSEKAAGKDPGSSTQDAASSHTDEALKPPPESPSPAAAPVPPPSKAEEHVARATSVAEASNLHKFVPLEYRRVWQGKATEADRGVLEEHLLNESRVEIEAALSNAFIPLMLVPEAAEFSATHQTIGAIFPEPHAGGVEGGATSGALWRLLLLPFKPVIAAYGGLGSMLEKLRLGLVATLPEVNVEVMMGIASVIPGADWIILRGYQLFGWGDRSGSVDSFGMLPKHRLDQELSDYVRSIVAQQPR